VVDLAEERLISSLYFALILCLSAIYVVRVVVSGRARFDRIERHGGSLILSKPWMEGAYWCLQPVSKILLSCGVSPNGVTIFSVFVAIGAGWLLGTGHFASAAVIGSLAALLDAVDGMLARSSGQASKGGAVLDSCMDRYSEFFFLAGAVFFYRHNPVVLLVGLLAIHGSFMVSYTSAKAEAMGVSPPKSQMRRPERALVLLLGAILSPWFTIPWGEGQVLEVPMVLALVVVAWGSSFAAISRVFLLARSFDRAEMVERPQLSSPERQNTR
jgi:CDP-diacylglycerol--glycerol-3-phosphate 3-phosphatidyltransferase